MGAETIVEGYCLKKKGLTLRKSGSVHVTNLCRRPVRHSAKGRLMGYWGLEPQREKT